MVKMADSAVIRQAMATMPREGSYHSASVFVCCSGTVAIVSSINRMRLLECRIRIFRMLQIPQRAAARHLRLDGEVVRGRRRGRGPFEGPRIPGVGTGLLAAEEGVHQVVDEYENGDGLN